jgi:hypothetical protein
MKVHSFIFQSSAFIASGRRVSSSNSNVTRQLELEQNHDGIAVTLVTVPHPASLSPLGHQAADWQAPSLPRRPESLRLQVNRPPRRRRHPAAGPPGGTRTRKAPGPSSQWNLALHHIIYDIISSYY